LIFVSMGMSTGKMRKKYEKYKNRKRPGIGRFVS